MKVLDSADEGYPEFSLAGYASFGDSAVPVSAVSNRGFFEGSFSYSLASHSIYFGGGFSAHQNNNNRSGGLQRGRFSFNGYYSGDAFADFLFGIPDTATRGVGSDRSDLRRKSWYFFARDQWKISPKVSLSYSLTYNYFQPYRSLHDNVSAFHPLLVEPALDGEIVTAGSERALQLGYGRAGRGGVVFPDRNDWAPSLGFAYRPFGNNRLMVRSSLALFYSPLGASSFVPYLGRNFPFYYVESAQATLDRPALDLTTPFATDVATELSIRGIEPHLRTAYVERWNLALQSEILEHWNLEASYDGSKATHMPRRLAGNVPIPGPGDLQPRRPNPAFGSFTILTGSGSYARHRLELSAERRLAGGVSIKSDFAWNRSLDDLFRGYPSNPRNLSAERGLTDFFPAHAFSLHYIIDLPFGRDARFAREAPSWLHSIIGGWKLSGITHIQEGLPYDVILKGDSNNDGISEDRPDRLGSGELDADRRSIDAWFDAAAFAAPAPFGFGNSGRNILTGPPYRNWDVSFVKQTRFADSHQLELRVELFNAFNQVNFELPNSVFDTSLFGKIFGARRAREIEIALRYSF